MFRCHCFSLYEVSGEHCDILTMHRRFALVKAHSVIEAYKSRALGDPNLLAAKRDSGNDI